MSVVVFAADDRSTPAVKLAASVELLGLDALKAYKPGTGDLCYLDCTGLDAQALAKAVASLRRRCADAAWAVIDPSGGIGDPAQLFFSGASDYIGPAACRTGLDKARIRAAQAFRAARRAERAAVSEETAVAGERDDEAAAGAFCGWKKVCAGRAYTFVFLYAAVSAHTNLKTRLGEAAFVAFRDRLRSLLQQQLAEADALLWMETESSALYLVPCYRPNAAAAAEACLRMLLGAPLLGYERLGLPFPVKFTFALHSGQTEFAPPGKTGTIVSDAVNYSFHLGAKRAEPERLTVSEDASGLSLPKGLEDLFVPAGTFEGRAIQQSRKFGA